MFERERRRERERLVMGKSVEKHEKVSNIKTNVFNLEIELKEQNSFLDNEKNNVRELQAFIDNEEHKFQKLNENLQSAEDELKEFQSEITLEKRQMWKAGSEMESKKVRMKETKGELNKQKRSAEKLKNDITDLKDAKVSCNNKALTAEERANQMQRLLDQEQLQHDMTVTEFHKARERLLAKQKEYKDISDEEEINGIRLKGLIQEHKNIDKQIGDRKAELIRREDVAVANDQRLVRIEREIARIKGTLSLDNRAELKAMLENFKLELDSRLVEKRNLDHLVHRMMCEVKKVKKDLESIDKNHTDVNAKLEEVMLVNESCSREHKQLNSQVEQMLLEEKVLKLTEKRVKADLEQLNNDLRELRKEDLEVNEQLREQRAELESKKDLYVAQSRCLKDELGTVKAEIKERKDKIHKLKIRHEKNVKAMGEAKEQPTKDVNSPSYAKHMVEVAQEKAELTEQTELLAKQIEKEEEELASLEKAMKLMKNSNDSYRATNCRINGELQTDQTIELEESIKNKQESIKQLQRRHLEIGHDIQHVEHLLYKCNHEVEKLKSFHEGKNIEVRQLEKELREQDKKLFRARNVVEKCGQELKEIVPNPEAYEHDMDLREEKEKQRAALIRLRDLSQADNNFSDRVHEFLTRSGVAIPPVSRLEARATSSRVATSGGYNSTSSRVWSTGTSGSSRHGAGYRAAGGHDSDSVVVMELSGTGAGAASSRRSKAALPVR